MQLINKTRARWTNWGDIKLLCLIRCEKSWLINRSLGTSWNFWARAEKCWRRSNFLSLTIEALFWKDTRRWSWHVPQVDRWAALEKSWMLGFSITPTTLRICSMNALSLIRTLDEGIRTWNLGCRKHAKTLCEFARILCGVHITLHVERRIVDVFLINRKSCIGHKVEDDGEKKRFIIEAFEKFLPRFDLLRSLRLALKIFQ